MFMRTYKEIENDLLQKINELKYNKTNFALYIGDKDGKFGDVLYFGIKKIFINSWIIIANDSADDFNNKNILIINPDNDINLYKKQLYKFISQYGVKTDNYYTFETLI